MEKRIYLLTVFFFILTSCGSNNDDIAPQASFVPTGTWNITTSEVKYTLNGLPISIEGLKALVPKDMHELLVEELPANSQIIFNSDNTYTTQPSSNGIFDDSGSWEWQEDVDEITLNKGETNEVIFDILDKSVSSMSLHNSLEIINVFTLKIDIQSQWKKE